VENKDVQNCTMIWYPSFEGRIPDMEKLKMQLNIIKSMKMKPNYSALAREYGIDRRTVKKYYEGYEGKPVKRNKKSKLDRYYEEIRNKLSIKGVTVKAVYEYLRDKGLDIGTYSNFNKYIKKKGIKASKKQECHPRFETGLGEQAQVDWKEGIKLISSEGEEIIFNVFSYKLSNSRYCYFEYRKSKTQRDLIECLINAFKYTGGVPKEILFDNMSSLVNIENGGRRRINNKMKAFAEDFRFKIQLCRPGRGCTKGKIETANKFIDWVIPYNYEFKTEEDLKQIIKNICIKVNTLVNQSTGVPPLLLFQKEKEYLSPLPNRSVMESYICSEHRVKVHKDSLVYYKGNRYSVPPKYINKTVTLEQRENELHIYYNTELISVHMLTNKRINYDYEHYKELLGRVMKEDLNEIEAICDRNLRKLDNFINSGKG